MEMVQRSARVVLLDDALDCLMSFVDFLYAFQIQFFYEGETKNLTIVYNMQTKSYKKQKRN